MAKKRGKTNTSEVIAPEPAKQERVFSQADQEYLLNHWKKDNIKELAKAVNATEDEVKAFLETLKKPGHGRSKAAYGKHKQGGVIVATSVSSTRGDTHKQSHNDNVAFDGYNQFSGAIHRPNG